MEIKVSTWNKNIPLIFKPFGSNWQE